MARWARAFFSVGLAFLPVAGAGAEPDDVRFVTGNNYQPYADADLPQGGMITAMVRAAYRTVPTEIAGITFTDWKRGYLAVKRGDYTATFPYVKTKKRQQEMLYSDKLYTTKVRVVTNAALPYEIDHVNDLHGLTYCTPKNYSPGSRVKAMERAGKVNAAHPYRMRDCLRMLRTERVDFIPSERTPVLAAAKKAFGSTDPVEFEPLIVQRTTLHAIFGKNVDGARAAMRTFNEAMRRLRERGAWQDIVDRYMP
jgi:polar amino acid transport system substrate-binding protein